LNDSGALKATPLPEHPPQPVKVGCPRVELAQGGEFPMAAIAQASKGLDWLAEEPELYSDADLIE
jgi:hypothetical protein